MSKQVQPFLVVFVVVVVVVVIVVVVALKDFADRLSTEVSPNAAASGGTVQVRQDYFSCVFLFIGHSNLIKALSYSFLLSSHVLLAGRKFSLTLIIP